jgi:tetratricopeptide (TPR) repeat protein
VPFLFDDLPNIVDKPIIKNLGNFISSSKGYAFNPRRFIGYLSFALNYHFGGLSVTGYHAINLVIHIVSAILVYFLVALTLKTPTLQPSNPPTLRYVALFSALLFVAHPIQTEAVTYIVQRLASLAAMFYLLSVVMYIKARITGDRLWVMGHGKGLRRLPITYYLLPITSLLSAVLAMKTKETAFTLPVIIILYEFIFFKSPLKKRLLFMIPILGTMLIIPISILGTNRPIGELISDISEKFRLQSSLPRWDYLMTQMRVITTYIRLLFLPVYQNLDYDYPVYHSLFQVPVFLSFIFLTALFGLGIYLIRSSRFTVHVSRPLRLIGFGILWFFITLSVESSFIPIADVIFEHRLYLPSAGAFIAITASAFSIAGTAASGRKVTERTIVIVMSLIIIALSGATFARNVVWGDGVKLWEDVVRKSPGNLRAHNNLVAELIEKKLYDRAITESRISLLMSPNNVDGHYNLGVIYQALNKFDAAVEEYMTAIKLKPDYVRAHLNLGAVYTQAFNQYDKAEKEFLTAVNLMPDLPEAHFNLGYIYYKKGQMEKARKELITALNIRPGYEKARQLLKTASQ